MAYTPTQTTPPGLAAIIDAYNLNLPISQQIGEINYVFDTIPVANPSIDFSKNTLIKAHAKALSGKYGVKSIFYDRVNLSLLPSVIVYDALAQINISDIVSLINANLGINLTTNDYVEEPIVLVNGNIAVHAKNTSLYYFGTLLVATSGVAVANVLNNGNPELVLDNNTLRILQKVISVVDSSNVLVRATLSLAGTPVGNSTWLPLTLNPGAIDFKIPSFFNPHDGSLAAGTYSLSLELKLVGAATNCFTTTLSIDVAVPTVITSWRHPTNTASTPYVTRQTQTQFIMHPGPNRELPSVRFTSPSTDTFALTAICNQDTQLDTNYCEIFVNGVSVLTTPNNGSFATISVPLNAGDIVDFTINGTQFGGGGNLLEITATRTRDNLIYNPGNHWQYNGGAQVLPWTWCYLDANHTGTAIGSPLLIPTYASVANTPFVANLTLNYTGASLDSTWTAVSDTDFSRFGSLNFNAAFIVADSFNLQASMGAYGDWTAKYTANSVAANSFNQVHNVGQNEFAGVHPRMSSPTDWNGKYINFIDLHLESASGGIQVIQLPLPTGGGSGQMKWSVSFDMTATNPSGQIAPLGTATWVP